MNVTSRRLTTMSRTPSSNAPRSRASSAPAQLTSSSPLHIATAMSSRRRMSMLRSGAASALSIRALTLVARPTMAQRDMGPTTSVHAVDVDAQVGDAERLAVARARVVAAHGKGVRRRGVAREGARLEVDRHGEALAAVAVLVVAEAPADEVVPVELHAELESAGELLAAEHRRERVVGGRARLRVARARRRHGDRAREVVGFVGSRRPAAAGQRHVGVPAVARRGRRGEAGPGHESGRWVALVALRAWVALVALVALGPLLAVRRGRGAGGVLLGSVPGRLLVVSGMALGEGGRLQRGAGGGDRKPEDDGDEDAAQAGHDSENAPGRVNQRFGERS